MHRIVAMKNDTTLATIALDDLATAVGGENPGPRQCNADYPQGGYDPNQQEVRAARPQSPSEPFNFPVPRGSAPDRHFAPQRYQMPPWRPTMTGRSDRRLKRRIRAL
jgi:hypothetical protein